MAADERPRTRSNPPETRKVKDKFMWTEPQRAIVVAWMKDNSKYYNDKNNTRAQRNKKILDSLNNNDFQKKMLMTVDIIESCIKYLNNGYKYAKKRLMKTGQGVTVEESDEGYKNLYGMLSSGDSLTVDVVCKKFIYFKDMEIIYGENHTANPKFVRSLGVDDDDSAPTSTSQPEQQGRSWRQPLEELVGDSTIDYPFSLPPSPTQQESLPSPVLVASVSTADPLLFGNIRRYLVLFWYYRK
jgi:hypothetical protein